jgi:hypothetical protein
MEEDGGRWRKMVERYLKRRGEVPFRSGHRVIPLRTFQLVSTCRVGWRWTVAVDCGEPESPRLGL